MNFEEFLWFKGRRFYLNKIGDIKAEKGFKKLFEEFSYFGSYSRAALVPDINGGKYYLKELIQTYKIGNCLIFIILPLVQVSLEKIN